MPRAGRLLLRCFGKIPSAGDFVDAAGKGRLALAWKRWCMAAFGGEAGLPGPGEGPIRRFEFRDSSRGWLEGALVGVLGPGVDRGGRRKFPFSCFFRLARRDVRDSIGVRLGRVAPLWARLEEGYRAAIAASDVETALSAAAEALSGAAVETVEEKPPTIAEALEAAGLRPHASSLAGALWRIRRAIEDPGGSPPSPIVVSFPVLPRSGALLQAEAWLGLLEAAIRRVKGGPSVFLPCGRSPDSRGFVFFRDLRARDGGLLFGPRPGESLATELGGPVPDSTTPEFERFARRVATVLSHSAPLSTLRTFNLFDVERAP